MKIKRIELYNFGSYEGETIFDLSSIDADKRIVVIGGKNGAGKTTLFTAIEMCLYGNFAFGYKTAGRLYFKEVFDLINNRARLNENDTAYVKISFLHTEARERCEYEITRNWNWSGGSIKEILTVLQNGIELDAESSNNFQSYLIHLIPPDMLKLYFFDGEKIADYFLSSQKINIRDAIMVLSGNDTFDILHDNVRRVLSLNSSENSSVSDEYLKMQDDRNHLQEQVAALNAQHDVFESELNELELRYEHITHLYAAKGGLTLDQWKDLQDKLKEEDERRERINWQRKSFATDILPFIIMQDMVGQVLPCIKNEEEYLAYRLLNQRLSASDTIANLTEAMVTAGIQDEKSIQFVLDRLSDSLLTGDWEGYRPILCLSDDEKMQVHSVLTRVFEFDPSSIKRYQKRLDKSLSESKRIRKQLQNSDVEHIEEYIRDTTSIESDIKVISVKIEQNKIDLQRAEEILSERDRTLAIARKSFEAQLKKASVAALSGRVMLMLEDLEKSVYSKLVQHVEMDLKYKLPQLIRKKGFFDDIKIDLNFDVHIIRNQNVKISDLEQTVKSGGYIGLKRNIGDVAFEYLCNGIDEISNAVVINLLNQYTEAEITLPVEFDKDRMSSGEKQIFVMALYWSLMQQSDNDLPFIIDTPFARIDTEHRANITEHFFMDLSGQLFVLSTNEELNGDHLEVMKDQVSQVYMLEYGDDKRTYVYQDKFFEV